ncbi:CRTAC1 family protein [Singulisphaera sp. PoT]|uniref:CRTAC1 family protein n=1 Tax=Singulisphaera sp. PoT TaxID=3411797 RepID=UPI003BF5D3A5
MGFVRERLLGLLTIGLISSLPLGCGDTQGNPTKPAPTTSSAKAPEPNASNLESLTKPQHEGGAFEGDRMANASAVPITLSKQTKTSPFRFAEIAKQAGVDFVHESGMTKERHFPTANGSGVAMFDYDGDGKLDLYFATQTLLPLGTGQKGPNRLYKNLGDGKFADMTEASGLGYRGFCHGIIVGDIDNDGDSDVFLCNYGSNVLYLNNGNGTFKDISKSAGVDRESWSSSGAFLDYDNDGDLDLYVSNYGEWIYPKDDVYCGNREKGVRLYCSPRSVRTVKHFLYKNNGDLTFTESADAAKIGRSDGHGFGVITADFNLDGKTDIYVANDMNPNFLFLNKGDGTFEDATESSGAAYDEKGQAQSGMGTDAEDVNGDGLPDILVTNFANEYNTLYQNLGKGSFMDVTPYFGLSSDTMPWVGWGTSLSDFDNDGWPDHFVSNGHVDNNRHELGQGVGYEEPALLFANQGGSRFSLATRDAGAYFDEKHVGRGAAFGDFDDDGDVDIVLNHKDEPAALLRNDTKNDNHWLRLNLRGTKSNRDAIGALVEVVVGDRTIARQRKGGCSMESSNDPRILVGVGPLAEVAKVTVKWPSGAVSTQEHVKVDQTLSIVEPDGK